MKELPPMSQRAALTIIESGADRYPRGRLREIAQRGLADGRTGLGLEQEVVSAAEVVFGAAVIEHGVTSLQANSRRWVRVDGEAFDRLKMAIEAMSEPIASEGKGPDVGE